MTRVVYATNQVELDKKLAGTPFSAEEWRARGALVGEAGQLLEQLAALAAAGCQQVMLQWLDQDDIAGLESLAERVLPQAGAL